MSDVIREQGGDIEDLLTARENEVQQAKEKGLLFDTNPEIDVKEQISTTLDKDKKKPSNDDET
jgi:capsid protein